MTSDVNTADSLRAAALSTIKAKRKKPEKPVRPQKASASLDYGQDDACTTPVLDSKTVNPGSNPETISDQPSHGNSNSDPLIISREDEDVQMREEGEISDEDGGRTSQAPQLADPTPDPIVVHTSVAGPAVKQEPESPKDKLLEFPFPAVSAVPTEDVIMDELEASPTLLDSSQIRPGLILNQAQYDRAKDLVLDLLGWGVPSEYLVDCGLSREIVFYVFSELQLRLPANLDVTGLSLSTGRSPSAHLTSLQSSSDSSRGHPVPLVENDDPSPMSPLLQPPIALASPSLHDIEQQRRKELLARKAAAQTYQSGDPDSNIPSHPPEQDGDTDMAPAPVIKAAVDDFLKTITPSAELDADMEDHPLVLEDPPPPQDNHPEDPPPTSGQSDSTSFSDAPPPPPSTSASTPSTASFPPESTVSEQIPRESTPGMSSRRGMKRPVAVDFVDFEAGSFHGPRPSHKDHLQTNGNVPSRHRQSSASTMSSSSFASVSGARRCVIDLSDSEDDVRNLEMIEHGLNGTRVPQRLYRADSALGKFDSPVTTGGIQTPTPGSDRGMSPASLEEKVQEIKRMRELIAKREQSRLTKLSRSNSVPYTPPIDTGMSTSDSIESLLPSVAEAEPLIHAAGLDSPGDLSDAQLHSKNPLINNGVDDVQLSADSTLHELSSASFPAPQEPSPTPHASPRASPSSQVMDNCSDRSESPEMPTPMVAPGRRLTHHEDSQPVASTSIIPSSDPTITESSLPNVTGDYSSYVSPLHGLPLLVARSRSSASGLMPPHPITAFSPIHGIPVVDMQPLKDVFYDDPMKQVCRYESGGGQCRNVDCDDVHLNRSDVDVQLTDRDIAEYLEGALPSDWRAHYGVNAQKMLDRLSRSRSSEDSTSHPLEQRVAQVLHSLVQDR